MIAPPTATEQADALARLARVADLLRDHPDDTAPAAREACSWQPADDLPPAIHNARVLRLLGHTVRAGAAVCARLLRQRHPDVGRDALVRAADGRTPAELAHTLGGVEHDALDAIVAAVADDERALHAAIGNALRCHGMGGVVALVVEIARMVVRETDEQLAALLPTSTASTSTTRHAEDPGVPPPTA